MSFDPFKIQLPITEVINECKQQLVQSNTLVVHAPPGAGKSTLLPLCFLEEDWLKGQKIIVLEPRRLAAKTIAQRMSDLLGTKLGQEVGYRIRFDSKVSDKTRIEVITEGILSKMLQSDNALEGIGLVIFDEFHERNLHSDLALALCKQSQDVLRTDLRLLIMSATLNLSHLEKRLNAPLISSAGKQYPVEMHYGEGRDVYVLPELCAELTRKALKEQEGDILVFLPGEGEIKRCVGLLEKNKLNCKLHPLYGMLPQHKQNAALRPDPEGKRKVVLATSIAETSLTIDGIRTVVDCGFSRVGRFDPRSGLSRLETIEITGDSADQRAGRAGRLGPGACYRLWTAADQMRMTPFRKAEILEADLSPLMLELAAWGNTKFEDLFWLDTPPKGHIMQAQHTLEEIGATEKFKITPHGKAIHQIPCHPRIAHLLLMAQEEELLELATDLAAILEERDPLDKEDGIDINLRIEALRKHRKGQKRQKRFERIEKIASSYRKLFELSDADNSSFDPYDTGLLLVYAYPDRIAHNRPGNNAQFKLANGKIAMASHQDSLAHETWLAIAHLQDRDNMGKIFMASPLNPKDLAPMVKQQEVVKWNARENAIQASIDLRIGNIVLQSKPMDDPDPDEVVNILLQEIAKNPRQLLSWDKEVKQWLNRLDCVKRAFEEEEWPSSNIEELAKSASEWLSPYLNNIWNKQQMKAIKLKEVLHNSLSYEQQKRLNEMAPEKIQIPSGSFIRLQYQENGQPPILAARIQELFGLYKSPTVNQGRTKLLLHLLSPAQRPIQVTSDLESFWANTYAEVRSELRIKYAKHYWPEDPHQAEAMKGVPKKK